VAAAERLRQAVEDQAMPHEGRPSPPWVVTLSGAASCWTPGSAPSTAALLARVDEGLYEAKSAGRNRIHAVSDRLSGPVCDVTPSRP